VRATATAARLSSLEAMPPPIRLLCRAAFYLWTMGNLSFFGAAFNVLGLERTLNLWSSLGYYGIWLLVIPAGAALGVLAVAPKTKASGREDSASASAKKRSD